LEVGTSTFLRNGRTNLLPCTNAEDCHWSNTDREDLKTCIVIGDTGTCTFYRSNQLSLYFGYVAEEAVHNELWHVWGDEKYDRVFVGKREGKKLL
jgi:hypothetical protein